MSLTLRDAPNNQVMYGHKIAVGDRVRHFGQRYNYSTGTATVTGFTAEKVYVRPDKDNDLYGSFHKNEAGDHGWDHDRTVSVAGGERWAQDAA